MIELIDIDGNIKFMANIICYLKYGDFIYAIYSIKRDDNDVNIFVSKVIENSDGYTLSNDFSSGEKESFDDVVTDLLDRVSVKELNSKGIYFLDKLDLVKINKFSVIGCYVTTCGSSVVKDCMNNYNLVYMDNVSVVSIRKGKFLSKDNVGDLLLILFGIFVIIVVVLGIIYFLRK